MNTSDFPILSQTVHSKKLVYLDNAATTQKPKEVIDAITRGYEQFNSNVHRGVHYLSQTATEHHEEARTQIAEFMHANSPKEIIFTKGTTDSINMLAFSYGEACIQEGDEIIVSELEHHSNIVPWQMLCQRKRAVLRHIPLKENLSIDMEAFEKMLSRKTKIVSIAHVSNVLGIMQPIENVIEICHKRNIPVCIDAAQSAPHIAIDVQKLDCDFLVCSAHKMYGPTGIGILYGKLQWLELLPPAQGGGEMIEHVRWDKTTYNTLPYKFEAGTPNFIGSYAYAAAIKYIQKNHIDKIHEYEKEIISYLEGKLSVCNNIRIYAQGLPKYGAISFNAYRDNGDLIHPFDVGVLLDQQGIAVRTGHHCAEPLMDYLKIPGTVRASIALYNNKEDIDTFITALQKTVDMLQG